LAKRVDVGVITNSLDGTDDDSVNSAVVDFIKLASCCSSEIIKFLFCSTPKKRSPFFQILVSEKGLDLVAAVINKGAEIKIVELIEKSNGARIWPSESKLDGGIAAEGRAVSKPIELVNLFGCSLDDLFGATASESCLV
jgi:hypothetical protein